MPDIERQLQERVKSAIDSGTPVAIISGGTKSFLGNRVAAQPLHVAGHSGIVDYDPRELVITARCGTKLQEIEQVLAASSQMLPFEPPHFGGAATLGGTVACGLSGPRRPYAGSVRDHVLGCRIINGRGEILNFGGKVMKNVAGFDVSRLMTGAFGTLGVLLEISLRVLPRPAASLTLVRECRDPVPYLCGLASKPIPVDAAAHVGGLCHIRLSGSALAVSEARNQLGGDALDGHEAFWEALREQRLPFFQSDVPLWRIASGPSAPMPNLQGTWVIDWGGSQRWLKSMAGEDDVRQAAEAIGGHATLFRGEGNAFHPLKGSLGVLHQRLKAAFDPKGIFNPGRLYPEF
ncbi:MAG: glycolate oxidase subunit GlcE [Burkholderiales bacterium]